MDDEGAQPKRPSKQERKMMKDAYQGRGAFEGERSQMFGAGATQAKDAAARRVATGQKLPEGQKPKFADKLRQRNAEREQRAQQRQYAQELAKQKMNEKRVASMAQGGLGRKMAMGALGKMAKGGTGKALGQNLGAFAKSGEGINRGLGRMGEREAAMQRLNEQKRRDARRESWEHFKKTGDIKGAINKLRKAPKKQQGVQARDHSVFMWGFLIGLAFVKDLLDAGTLSFGSFITWIIAAVWGFSMFFFLGRKNMEFTERIIKTLIPALLEFIPFLNFVPILTFSVLYIWYRSEIMTQLPAKEKPKNLPG